jgi:hypothetical protein
MTDWFVYDDGGRSESRRPKSKNDCTVRALAIATFQTYDDAYEFWAKRGRIPHRAFDNRTIKLNFEKHFEWPWISFPAVKGEKRMSHPQFEHEHPTGIYILKEAGHVSAVVNGVLHDTFQPWEGRCIYGAWRVRL